MPYLSIGKALSARNSVLIFLGLFTLPKVATASPILSPSEAAVVLNRACDGLMSSGIRAVDYEANLLKFLRNMLMTIIFNS